MARSLIDAAAIGVLAVWLAVTVIAHVRPGAPERLRWPATVLFVLGHGLFAEVPRSLELSIRDRSLDGRLGAWTPVEWHAHAPWYQLVWAPRYWHDVHLLGAVTGLLRARARVPGDRLTANVRYRLVLGAVQARPRSADSASRQFRITRVGGFAVDHRDDDRDDDNRDDDRDDHRVVLLTSDFHRW